MEPVNTSFRPREGFVPNPKLRLREQLREVMRFKQFSRRTEEAYWVWIKQYLVFHRRKAAAHPHLTPALSPPAEGLKVLPEIMSDGNFGIQSNAFGFDITGISNQTAVIEFSTNLPQPAWLPLQTNILTGSPEYFSDPGFGQNASGFYRIRSP